MSREKGKLQQQAVQRHRRRQLMAGLILAERGAESNQMCNNLPFEIDLGNQVRIWGGGRGHSNEGIDMGATIGIK